MSRWKVIRPLAATNWILNPSAETTGNYAAAVGGETITRELGDGCYGNYGYKIVPGAADRGIDLTAATPASPTQVYFAAKDVTGVLTVTATASETAEPIQELGDGWWLYQAVNAGFAGTSVEILNSENETWYLDGVVYCAPDELQTYLDGDQPGCNWSGPAHGSYSTRAVTTRAGGEVVDFEDDLYFWIVNTPGDTTSLINMVSERPFRAGGSVDLNRVPPRTMILLGWLRASTLPSLHTRWAAMMDIFRPDAVPAAADGRPQAHLIQYWGDERVLQLRGHYRIGLEEHQAEGSGFQVKIPLTFDIAEPYWEAVIETAVEVDATDTFEVHLVFGLYDGAWIDMGPPTQGQINVNGIVDLLEDNQYVYYVGHSDVDFGALNADADQVGFARYNKLTGAWSGTGAINGQVWRVIRGPDGSLYICGAFTTVDGGGVAALRIARYVPGTDTWTAVGNTFNAGTVRDIIFDERGWLYAAWDDEVWYTNDPTNAVAAWNQVGATDAGVGNILSLAFEAARAGNVSYLYVGGDTADFLAYANVRAVPPTWASIAGIDNDVFCLKMLADQTLFLGGRFTGRMAYYRDTIGIVPVAGTPNDTVIYMDYDDHTGIMYVSGQFTEVGDLVIGDTAARYHWPGDYWSPVPFTIDPGADDNYYITRIRVGPRQSPIDPSRNLWFAYFDSSLTDHDADLYYPGSATIVTANIPGGAESKPVITLSADDAATINSIVNRITGDEIVLDAVMAPGDVITIDLVNLRVWSEFGNPGPGPSPIFPIIPKPGSRFASWSLMPTGNIVDIRINSTTANITGTLRYIQRYHSYRSADVA